MSNLEPQYYTIHIFYLIVLKTGTIPGTAPAGDMPIEAVTAWQESLVTLFFMLPLYGCCDCRSKSIYQYDVVSSTLHMYSTATHFKRRNP